MTFASSASGTGFCARRVDLRAQRLGERVGRRALGSDRVRNEQSRVDVEVGAERRLLRDLPAIDQRLVQARRLAVAEQRGRDAQRRGVGAARRRAEPGHRHRGQRHVRAGLAIARVAACAAARRASTRGIGVDGSRECAPKYLSIQPSSSFWSKSPVDDQHRVVGPIVRAVERAHVVERRRVELVDVADHAAPVRMHRVRARRDRLVEAAVRIGQHALRGTPPAPPRART